MTVKRKAEAEQVAEEEFAPLGKTRWERVASMAASPEAVAAIEAWMVFKAKWAAFEEAHAAPEGLFWHMTGADTLWVDLIPEVVDDD